MTTRITARAAALTLCLVSSTGYAADNRQAILSGLAEAAKAKTQTFAGFSVERGRDLYFASSATGKPDTPSCTSCHTNAPINNGLTRAGKAIDPMALSKTPTRYTDPEKVEKWFRRNCNSVLGRDCTAIEKGDFITFMTTQ